MAPRWESSRSVSGKIHKAHSPVAATGLVRKCHETLESSCGSRSSLAFKGMVGLHLSRMREKTGWRTLSVHEKEAPTQNSLKEGLQMVVYDAK